MMTVSRRDGYAANSMQKVVCVIDANTPITVAAQYSGPDGQAETGSSPLIAGSSPQRGGAAIRVRARLWASARPQSSDGSRAG
jgi:hypothetical protein